MFAALFPLMYNNKFTITHQGRTFEINVVIKYVNNVSPTRQIAPFDHNARVFLSRVLR